MGKLEGFETKMERDVLPGASWKAFKQKRNYFKRIWVHKPLLNDVVISVWPY